MKPLFIIAAATVLAATATARAQDYHVHGAGAVSCGTWTEHRSQHGAPAAVMQSWVQGYVSGVNGLRAVDGLSGDLTESTDDNGLFSYVDRYCEAHPLDRMATGVENLLAELNRRKAAPSRP